MWYLEKWERDVKGEKKKTQEHGADKSLTMYFLSKGNNIQYYNLQERISHKVTEYGSPIQVMTNAANSHWYF